MNGQWVTDLLARVAGESWLAGRLLAVSVELVVLAAAVGLLIAVLRIRAPRLRALLWLLVLAKPVIGLLLGAPVPVARVAVVERTPGEDLAALMAATSAAADAAWADAGQALGGQATGGFAGMGAGTLAGAGATGEGAASGPSDGAARRATAGLEAGAKKASAPYGAVSWPQVAGWVWLAGVVLFSGITLIDQLRIRRLRRDATEAPLEMRWRLAELASDLGLKRAPRLLVTDRLESPALAGWVRPDVLVPRWMVGQHNNAECGGCRGQAAAEGNAEWGGAQAERDDAGGNGNAVSDCGGGLGAEKRAGSPALPGGAADWMLRHELMHYRLNDPVALAVRRLAEVLFFFHPAVWWAGRRWEESMELACDRALVESESDARAYAEGLYRVLAAQGTAHGRSPALGLFATRTQIGRRIAALLANPLASPARLSAWTVTGLTVVAAAVMATGVGFSAPEAETGVNAVAATADNPLGLTPDRGREVPTRRDGIPSDSEGDRGLPGGSRRAISAGGAGVDHACRVPAAHPRRPIRQGAGPGGSVLAGLESHGVAQRGPGRARRPRGRTRRSRQDRGLSRRGQAGDEG